MQVRGLSQVAEAQLPVVRHDGRQRLDEVHEVRVRGLQVLDDGPELATLPVREDTRDHDVEGVAREAVGGAAETGKPTRVGVRVEGGERVRYARRGGKATISSIVKKAGA